MLTPKRLILHWTAGTHKASSDDLKHYHWCVEGGGEIKGGVPLEANLRQVKPWHTYAAHTRAFNAWSAGLAFCGMRYAFPGGSSGTSPLLPLQVDSGLEFVARKFIEWGLPVNEQTLFTHWEAEELHGVDQKGKWDITVLPWDKSIKEDEVGSWLRQRVLEYVLRNNTERVNGNL